jgi:hypothetical protein
MSVACAERAADNPRLEFLAVDRVRSGDLSRLEPDRHRPGLCCVVREQRPA